MGMKVGLDTFRALKSVINEFLRDDESAFCNIDKFLSVLENNKRIIEGMKWIMELAKKERYYDQYLTSLEDDYNIAINESKELHAKIISSPILNLVVLKNFMNKKIESLDTRIDAENLDEKLTQLHDFSTDLKNEFELYKEQVFQIYKILDVGNQDKFNAYEKCIEKLLEKLTSKVKELEDSYTNEKSSYLNWKMILFVFGLIFLLVIFIYYNWKSQEQDDDFIL